MSATKDKAWRNVGQAAYGKTKDMNKVYSNWAKEFDDDMIILGYLTPDNLAEEMMKYINNSLTSQMLDVGAGSGS